MSRAIQAGDMVRLVWACCAGGRKHLGWVGVVSKLGTYHGSTCWCGYKTYGAHAWINIGTDGVVPVSWLIKIEPTSELKDHLTQEPTRLPTKEIA